MKHHPAPHFPCCMPEYIPHAPHPDGCGCPSCRTEDAMCHEHVCGCDRCSANKPPIHRPTACREPARFLLPRIVGCGRCWLRCTAFTLHLDGLPDCLQPPLMLVGVSNGCDAPYWSLSPGCKASQQCLHVVLPLCCEVRDCSGCTYQARAFIEVDMTVQLSVPQSECWRSCVMLQPCVRLVCPPPASQQPCFDAQLDVLIEAYLTHWEPCASGGKPERC